MTTTAAIGNDGPHDWRSAVVALPARTELPLLIAMSAAFGAWFYGIYWLAYQYTGAVAERLRVDLAWEAAIPFWPWASVLYMTITPLLLLAPFVLRTARTLAPLFAALVLQVAIAGVAFVLFPAELGYPAPVITGPAAVPFAVMKAINLTYNLVPSLHVAFACTAAAVLARAGGPRWAFGLWLWGIAIVASTLVTHQHHVLDVAAGAALAAATLRWPCAALERRLRR